jgi:hypothetical protein
MTALMAIQPTLRPRVAQALVIAAYMYVAPTMATIQCLAASDATSGVTINRIPPPIQSSHRPPSHVCGAAQDRGADIR